jgi:hypothetical protein
MPSYVDNKPAWAKLEPLMQQPSSHFKLPPSLLHIYACWPELLQVAAPMGGGIPARKPCARKAYPSLTPTQRKKAGTVASSLVIFLSSKLLHALIEKLGAKICQFIVKQTNSLCSTDDGPRRCTT